MLSDLSGGEPSSQSLSKVRSSATTVNQWGMSHEPPPVVAQPVPAENLATSSEPEEDVPLIDGTLSRNILHLQPAPSEHHKCVVLKNTGYKKIDRGCSSCDNGTPFTLLYGFNK